MKRALWRDSERIGTPDEWRWRASRVLAPFGPWTVIGTTIRGKWHTSLLDDVFGYATAGDLPEGTDAYPIPPFYCKTCDRIHPEPAHAA